MTIPDAHLREELMEQLRKANEHFHQSREAWEQSLAAADFDHEERIEAARRELEQAEREVEEVEERIRKTFPPAAEDGRPENADA
jgi:hypothetical protein